MRSKVPSIQYDQLFDVNQSDNIFRYEFRDSDNSL